MPLVALVVPCYVEVLRPAERSHARRVLEALGDTVNEVRARCCGQPAFNAGHRDEARAVGRELLRAVQGYEAAVMPSGSCTSMVRHYLPSLFEGDRSRAAVRIGSAFQELASYVAAHRRRRELELSLAGTIAYHDSCHTRRELANTGQVLDLLGSVEGLEVRRIALEDECCGFGGTFSVTQPEVSRAMRSDKLREVLATGARAVVSTDLSCLSQIATAARQAGEPLEAWTVSELLAKALP